MVLSPDFIPRVSSCHPKTLGRGVTPAYSQRSPLLSFRFCVGGVVVVCLVFVCVLLFFAGVFAHLFLLLCISDESWDGNKI